MAKKKVIKQKQKQKQSTNIVIKINNAGRKKTSSKPRKIVAEAPMRQLPPVVYQTLPQLTFYTTPSSTGAIVAPPAPPSSIISHIPPKTSIVEMQDVGVGTEGLVKILDLPSRRETLSELITPVSTAPIPRKPLNIVPEPKPIRKPKILDAPTVVIDPVESGEPLSPPAVIIDPVESGKPLISNILKDMPMMLKQKIPKPPTEFLEPKQTRLKIDVPPSVIIDPVESGEPLISDILKDMQPEKPPIQQPLMGPLVIRTGKNRKENEVKNIIMSRESLPSQISGEMFMPESISEPGPSQTGFITSKVSSQQPKIISGKVKKPEEMMKPSIEETQNEPPFQFFPQETKESPFIGTIRDVRSKAGTKGGIYSKKMTDAEKASEYFNIPLERTSDQDIIRMQEEKKRLARERKAKSRQNIKNAPPVPAIAAFTGEQPSGFFTSQNVPTEVVAVYPEESFGIGPSEVMRESQRVRQTSPRPTASKKRSSSQPRMTQTPLRPFLSRSVSTNQ